MMHIEEVASNIFFWNKRNREKNVERKNYNVVIDWKNVFDQPVKIDLITYENIRKNATGRGDDYNYFKNYIRWEQ